jgi:hypothetical protein
MFEIGGVAAAHLSDKAIDLRAGIGQFCHVMTLDDHLVPLSKLKIVWKGEKDMLFGGIERESRLQRIKE